MNGAQSGGSLTVSSCIYRETVTVSRPIRMIARPGAEVRGSDVWTKWKASGATWASTLVVPAMTEGSAGNCASSSPLCSLVEQVFRDGVAQTRTSSNPTEGQFALESGRHVVLGSKPVGHTIEVSLRNRWLIID